MTRKTIYLSSHSFREWDNRIENGLFSVTTLNQQFYFIFLQPVIHLQKIRKQLRSGHELPVERSAVVGGLADVVEYFVQVNQFPQGGARVRQCFHDRGAQQVFVGGVIRFGIRTLSAV